MNSHLASRIEKALYSRGDKPALVAEGTTLSGSELLNRARELRALISEYRVLGGNSIAISVDRSVESIVSILATLAADCAYLPLDPRLPEAWLSHLVTIARPKLLIGTSDEAIASMPATLKARFPLGVTMARSASSHRTNSGVSENKPGASRPRPYDIAYIMGTSGSTGTVKAVPTRASSLLSYCEAFAARLGGTEEITGLSMVSTTTLGADLGNTMVFPALLYGAVLHLLPNDVARDPELFGKYVYDHSIDALKIVPTHLRALSTLGAKVLPRRLLIVGGEIFGLDLLTTLEAYRPSCTVYNHYGPTEATIGVAMYRVETQPGSAEQLRRKGFRCVPIGTALGNCQLHVVDERLRPVGKECVGELVVSGSAVADGYLGASNDVRAPFIDWGLSQRAYRTGDLVEEHGNGQLEFIRRKDRQIKIRGHRIEPAGIEAVLRSHPYVSDAFVNVERGTNADEVVPTLLAWVSGECLNESSLRTFLEERIPEPMIPSRITVMQTFPRTENGKVDTRALITPSAEVQSSQPNAIEDVIAQVFAKTLRLPVHRVAQDFFQLGGHSLLALQVVSELQKQHGITVSVHDFYGDPTPSGVARTARRLPPSGTGEATVPGRSTISRQVLGLWTHLQLNPLDATYAIPVHLNVQSGVEVVKIHQALKQFVARHESLRTRYSSCEGRPVAVVDNTSDRTLRFLEASATDPGPEQLDTVNGPIIVAKVTTIGPGRCRVALRIHHLGFDGASLGILVEELAAMLSDQDLLPAQRACVVGQSNSHEAIGAGARSRFGLGAAPQRIGLSAKRLEMNLPVTLWRRVEDLATAAETTPFVVGMAAWALVLSRQDAESAVTIATPVDLRDPLSENRAVGFHSDLVVVELGIEPAATVQAFLKRTHRALGKALDERDRAYADLVAQQRNSTGTPPARTLFALERLEHVRTEAVDISQEPVFEPRPILDVNACVRLGRATAVLQIDYRLDVCEEWRACSLGEQLLHVLAQLTLDSTAMCNEIDTLAEESLRCVLDWSRGRPEVVPCIEAAERAINAFWDPDGEALLWCNDWWTRADFDRVVQATAKDLADRGVGPGQIVTLSAPVSPALAVGWHATRRIGAAVMSLDPAWKHRQDYAIASFGTGVRINSIDGTTVTLSGEAAETASHAKDLAYVAFTSAASGLPKLVGITGSALDEGFAWYRQSLRIGKDDKVLVLGSPGSERSAWEMLGPLAWGASLVFPQPDHRSADALAELIATHGVTVILAAPYIVERLLSRQLSSSASSVRLLLCYGEELASALPAIAARLLPTTTVIGIRGRSETPFGTVHQYVHQSLSKGQKFLGKPLPGIKTYVLDDRLRPLPAGAWGRLAVAGTSLASSYIDDEAETARRFVADPFSSIDGRMLLTDDRIRWHEGGQLEFGGASEHQVSVNMNKFWLEEVESLLQSFPLIRDAVIHVDQSETESFRMRALVIPEDEGAVTANDLADHCASLLPPFMRPSEFGFVAQFPRISNGNVARHSLPLEIFDRSVRSISKVSETERQVARVWCELLHHDTIGRSTFFAAGGTSLLIPSLQARLRDVLGVTLSVPELFMNTTIAAQALAIETKLAGDSNEEAVVLGRGKARLEAYTKRRKVRK